MTNDREALQNGCGYRRACRNADMRAASVRALPREYQICIRIGEGFPSCFHLLMKAIHIADNGRIETVNTQAGVGFQNLQNVILRCHQS